MTKVWRSFAVALADTMAEAGCKRAETVIEFLEAEAEKLLADPSFVILAESLAGSHRGDFWCKVANSYGPHRAWKQNGNRAKFYRILLERVRCTVESQEERKKIAAICSRHHFDLDKKTAIRQELADNELYPSDRQVKTICAGLGSTPFPSKLPIPLDFTVGDKQIIRELETGRWSVQLLGEWHELAVRLPIYLRAAPLKLAKPVIERVSGKLLVRVAYQLEADSPAAGGPTVGVDLGRAKIFAAAASWSDGSYSTELVPSRELARLEVKIKRLEEQLAGLYAKREHFRKLAANNPEAAHRFERLAEEAASVSSKRSRLKGAAAWLVARDVLAHAETLGASRIAVEDLRFVECGGKWNYSQVQGRLAEAAELKGVVVERVPAAYSSQTDPFTDQRVKASSGRRLLLSDGSALDRDYTAALELSRRHKKKPKGAPLKKTACRDKHAPTPKRPKKQTRTSARKRLVKLPAGPSPLVAASVSCSPSGQAQSSSSGNTQIINFPLKLKNDLSNDMVALSTS